jgi:succinate dehydrogenase flavin-adding protein (antitoxin of CptAB toxin-antitoxin module)
MTAEEIIQKLGIDKVDPETQKVLLDNLANTVATRVMAKVSERLSDEDLDQLDALIDKNDEGAVEWFVKSKFENYDEFAAKVEEEVIDELATNKRAIEEAYKNGESPVTKLNL